MKSTMRIAVAVAGAAAVLAAGMALTASEAEAKRKPVCTDASGVALGGTKKEATIAAKQTAAASGAALLGTPKVKVKPFKVSCSPKLVFIECTAATKACK